MPKSPYYTNNPKLVKTRVFISSNAINEVNLRYFAMKWQNFGIIAYFCVLPIYRVILSDHLFLLHNVAPWSYELKTANNIATALITFLPEPIEYVWAWAKLAEI